MRQIIRLAPFALLLALPSCAPPGTSASTCDFTVAAVMPVTYLPGHIPVVTITIAGHPLRMMVDSGDGDSILTPAAYDRLNLVGTRNFDITASGVSGDMSENKAILEDIMVGQTKLHDDAMIISNFGGNGTPGHPLVDGIIGEDVLSPFNVAWDLPSNQITLFAPSDCAQHQAPWPGDYDVESFTLSDVGAPLLPYQINGQNIQVILDSGAYSTLLQQADLDKAGITPQSVSTSETPNIEGINGKSIPGKFDQFSNVTIGAESFSNVWLQVANTHAAIQIPSVIGEDYLATHRVFIDYANNTAYLGLTMSGH